MTTVGGSDRQFCYYTHWKHEEFRVAYSERAQCADAFKFKFNTSFVLKYCACAFVVFLAGLFTLAVNDNMHSPFQGPFFRSLSFEKVTRTRGANLASKGYRRSYVNMFFWARNRLYCAVVCVFLTLRRLMSYIYGAPILDVSRSHITTQHSR